MEVFVLYTNEASLQHFGIKGMKWGVRKRYDALSDKQKTGVKIGGAALAVGATAAIGYGAYRLGGRKIRLQNLAAKTKILTRQRAHYDAVFDARVSKYRETLRVPIRDVDAKMRFSLMDDIAKSSSDRMTWDPEYASAKLSGPYLKKISDAVVEGRKVFGQG